MAQLILTVRCNYCSKHFPASRLIRQFNGVRICHNCYEAHNNAVDLIPGGPMPECQECKKTALDLAVEQNTKTPRMVAQWKDGIYQMLCHQCSDKYEHKRRDLYGETEYGHRKGISA